MHRDELPIPKPCSADWNAMEPRGKARYCAECAIEVVDVSAHREADARALASAVRAHKTCVSYIVRADGSIRFADSPDVPTQSLRRRGASLVAAAGLALAACSSPGDRRTAGAPLEVGETHTVGNEAAPPACNEVTTPRASPPQSEVRLNGGLSFDPSASGESQVVGQVPLAVPLEERVTGDMPSD